MDNYGVNNQNNSNSNSIALVAMILGIVSIILCWVPIIGLVLSIVGLILGVKGLNNSKMINKGKGFSIAGISCGSVGIVLSIIYTIVWIFTAWIIKTTVNEIESIYDDDSYNYKSKYNYTYEYDSDDINSILDDYKYYY